MLRAGHSEGTAPQFPSGNVAERLSANLGEDASEQEHAVAKALRVAATWCYRQSASGPGDRAGHRCDDRSAAVRPRRGQCSWPTISMVSTPAMISPIPRPIIAVSGSANRNLANTATSATPHADQTP